MTVHRIRHAAGIAMAVLFAGAFACARTTIPPSPTTPPVSTATEETQATQCSPQSRPGLDGAALDCASTEPPTHTPTHTLTLAPSATATPARSAMLHELVNEVLARVLSNDDWADVHDGQAIQNGGGVQTRASGRAAVYLSEGTIIRIAPQTTFTLTTLEPDPRDPFARLQLFAGKLWVVLGLGELEVETPVGVASVRGSLLSVTYDPETDTVIVTCLEGHCTLSNGGQTVELEAGQAAEVQGVDAPPSDPRPMTEEEVEKWLENNPEATLAPLPTNSPEPTTAVPTNTQPPPTATPQPSDTPVPAPPPPPPPSDGFGSAGGLICLWADTMEPVDPASVGVGD